MIKVLILGSKGMLGNQIYNLFSKKKINVFDLSRIDFDILNEFNKLEEVILFTKPDYIINCISINDIKSNFSDMIFTNSTFPKKLALLATALKFKLFHISTNGVFKNDIKNADENNYNFTNENYGLSKLFGENEKLAFVIRTSIIGFSINKKYFLDWILNYNGISIKGYQNHIWNGVTTLELAMFILKVIENDLFENGIYHVHSKKSYSKFEIICMVNEIFDKKLNIEKSIAENIDIRTLSTLNKLQIQIIETDLFNQLKSLKDIYYQKN